MNPHSPSPPSRSPGSEIRLLLGVFASLLVVLAISAVASHFLHGTLGTVVALFCAFVKLGLIFAFFMRLRESGSLVRLAAVTGFIWLGIAAVLLSADYLTRM